MLHQSNFLAVEVAPARTEMETWVKQIASLCEADAIHCVDGSKEEYEQPG